MHHPGGLIGVAAHGEEAERGSGGARVGYIDNKHGADAACVGGGVPHISAGLFFRVFSGLGESDLGNEGGKIHASFAEGDVRVRVPDVVDSYGGRAVGLDEAESRGDSGERNGIGSCGGAVGRFKLVQDVLFGAHDEGLHTPLGNVVHQGLRHFDTALLSREVIIEAGDSNVAEVVFPARKVGTSDSDNDGDRIGRVGGFDGGDGSSIGVGVFEYVGIAAGFTALGV